MENMNDIKIKLIQKICESSNHYLLFSILKNFDSNPKNIVAEPEAIYESERPMTEEEVDDYFKDEQIILPTEILEILKISEEQIKNGQTFTNEEVKEYFEEWLKD